MAHQQTRDNPDPKDIIPDNTTVRQLYQPGFQDQKYKFITDVGISKFAMVI